MIGEAVVNRRGKSIYIFLEQLNFFGTFTLLTLPYMLQENNTQNKKVSDMDNNSHKKDSGNLTSGIFLCDSLTVLMIWVKKIHCQCNILSLISILFAGHHFHL